MHARPLPLPVGPESLLAHREWVRRVARALVSDGHLAEDLEQDLWVEALERPPRPRRSLRGWLAVALRSRLLNLRRADSRRVRREHAASRRESLPPAAEVVAEAEAHRRVVDAVMELDEPYRTALLLRFFEDLGPSAAGERLGVPAETVRTRVRRALVLLRERLDAGNGGDSEFRALVLAPLLPRPIPATAGTGFTVGGLVMTQKAVIVAAAAVLAGGGLAGWAAARAKGDPGASARLADEVAGLRTVAEDQSARIARLERPRGAGEAEGRLRFLLEEQAVRAERLERSVATVAGQEPALDRLERTVAALEGKVATPEPAAQRKQALDRLLAINDPRRQLAMRDALADVIRMGDLVVPDIVATLDSGFERYYFEPGAGMAMGAGEIRYGSARMTLIDALRQIGTPVAKKALLEAVGRSKRLGDYRDLLFPYQGTRDPALVEGITALVPDMVRALGEVSGEKWGQDARDLARALIFWIHGHVLSDSAGPIEEVVRKARPGPDGWSNEVAGLFTLLVEFAPERAVEAILDLQERYPKETPERPPVVALASAGVFGLDRFVSRAQVARYYELLFTRGSLEPDLRRKLYSAIPVLPFTGIQDPVLRAEDARVLEKFLDSRRGVEGDVETRQILEWQLTLLRGGFPSAGK